MDSQDTKFNYNIIIAALVAVIIGILIAFYYSYAQSQNQITFLEQEKELMVKDLTLMRTEVDRLLGENEVNEIDLQDSRFRVQQLLDSVGRLNFNIAKLKEGRKEFVRIKNMYDSLKLKNNFLRYNNSLLANRYDEARKQLEELKGKSSSLAQAESLQRQKILELNRELKLKSYAKLQEGATEGTAFRLRAGRPMETNKASTVEKLRGCVTILAEDEKSTSTKVIYFQFLDPNMTVIEDNANTISVSGNTYSRRVELVYFGDELDVCDAITVPEGSLEEGIYTLNIFEDERLLSSTEFQLK
jgi:hypothetical protein